MISPWRHHACTACFDVLWPDRRPVVVRDTPPLKCCWCGGPATVYLRAIPATVPCQGDHPR